MEHYAIAIDGPAGSGKSTVAKKIAKRLNIVYIDTGAMYRTVAYYCILHGIDPKEEKAVCAVLPAIEMEFLLSEGKQEIVLNGTPVGENIRTPEAGQGSSQVAAYLPVREYLVKIQRKLAEGASVIMDGRDIGTNVLPDAKYKIFLSASIEERARRRLLDFERSGKKINLEEVKKQIIERDENDKNRKHNPLCMAADAALVDTTGKTEEETLCEVLQLVQSK